VSFYQNLNIYIDSVKITDLLLLTKYLERFKISRMNQISALTLRFPIPWAAKIVGSRWHITPPVVEKTKNGSLVVIDGAHRVYNARSRGEEYMKLIIVENSEIPLPCSPVKNWDRISVELDKKPRQVRYRNFQPSLFRSIRSSFELL